MVTPPTSKDDRSGQRGSSPSWYRELVELGALFLAVSLADLFANTLAHRPLGPVVLISLGVSLLLSAALHRRYAHHPAHPPSLPRTARPPSEGLGTSPGTAEPGNLWRVRTAVRHNPGSLAALTASLASHGLNILAVQIHAATDGAVDEFLLETPPGTTDTDVIAATETGGGRDVHAVRTDMHDLVDVPTRMLRLAAQVIDTRLQLAAALRALLSASTVSRHDPDGNDHHQGDQMHNTTMRLGDPAGGILTFQRPTLPFTPAEFARARALRDLAPPPPLAHLTSHYQARPRRQTAIEPATEEHQNPNPDNSHPGVADSPRTD